MIQANELRIGNKIWVPSIDKIVTVSYHEIRYASIHPENNYDPINLTHEILENLGFEYSEQHGFVSASLSLGNKFAPNGSNEYKFVAMYIKGNDTNIVIDYTVNDYWASMHIRYVHQLQNLYFALMGEELDVQKITK